MSDLLLCPFCGSEPEIERMGTSKVSMIICCENCGAKVECGNTSVKNSNWNDRVDFSTVEDKQLISKEAITYMFEQYPEIYKEFYKLI